GDVLVPDRTGPKVIDSHVEVGLDEDRGCRSRGFPWRHQNASGEAAGEDNARDADDPLCAAAIDEQATGDEGVAADKNEADAVDAGPWGEMSEDSVVDLRIAELVPRNGGDAGGGEIKRGPENRRGSERPADVPGGAAHEQDSPGEDAEVETKDEAETSEHEGGGPGRQAAVYVHGVVNPVAVTCIPEHAADVAEEKGAAERMGRAAIRAGEDSGEERDEREPGKDGAPGGHGAGEGERQLEQCGGEDGGCPELPGCAVHTGPSLMHQAQAARGCERKLKWE